MSWRVSASSMASAVSMQGRLRPGRPRRRRPHGQHARPKARRRPESKRRHPAQLPATQEPPRIRVRPLDSDWAKEQNPANRANLGSVSYLVVVTLAGQARRTRPRPLSSDRVTSRLVSPRALAAPLPRPAPWLRPRSHSASGPAAPPFPRLLSVLTTRSHLPITSDQTNRVKAGAEVVRTDRKAKKWSEVIGRWRVPGKPGCYVGAHHCVSAPVAPDGVSRRWPPGRPCGGRTPPPAKTRRRRLSSASCCGRSLTRRD